MTTHDEVRAIAREEVASLCGLVLNRLQQREQQEAAGDVEPDDPGLALEKARDEPITLRDLERVFGEGLRDFSSTRSEPGP